MEVKITGVRASEDCESKLFGIRIQWHKEDVGYGYIDITQREWLNFDDIGDAIDLDIETECMGADFVKEVLCKLVDYAITDVAKE